jgi:predicted phosphoribosyltransferase
MSERGGGFFGGVSDKMPHFRDRRDAGRKLAETLEGVRAADTVVLAIPRGGVVIGHEVALALEAKLDVVVVRKLGYPRHEEAAFGAIGENGVLVPEYLARITPGDSDFQAFRSVIDAKQRELEKLVQRYRGRAVPVPIRGATAIVVDDGIATGFTFAAALAIARSREPARLIAAAPVASHEGTRLISGYSDEVITLGTAGRGLFFAVSLYYDDFPQVSDEEVVRLVSPPDA